MQSAAAGVRASVAAFNEVRDNLSEGLRFYASLQEAAAALQQTVGDFCLTRRIERCAVLPVIVGFSQSLQFPPLGSLPWAAPTPHSLRETPP